MDRPLSAIFVRSLWCSGAVVFRRCGVQALWCSGAVVFRRNGCVQRGLQCEVTAFGCGFNTDQRGGNCSSIRGPQAGVPRRASTDECPERSRHVRWERRRVGLELPREDLPGSSTRVSGHPDEEFVEEQPQCIDVRSRRRVSARNDLWGHVPWGSGDVATSRQHAEFVRSDRGVVVADLGSRNGTLVDGQLVNGPTPIEPGAVVEIGRITLMLITASISWALPAQAGLAGVGPGVAAVIEQVGRVASRETPVLLLGETGVGKERIAAMLHERSGLVRAAADGTLLLDELGDCGSSLQQNLLRLVETQEYRAVGSDHALHATCRFVAAAQPALETMGSDGPVSVGENLGGCTVCGPQATPIDCPIYCDGSQCVHATNLRAGGDHTCAEFSNGEARCWGRRIEAQIGDGAFAVPPAPPTWLHWAGLFTPVTAGWYHTCVLLESGSTTCFGHNSHGQAGGDGDGDYGVLVSVVVNATRLFAGARSSCAAAADGSLSCWGYALNGQLATGIGAESSPIPTRVSGFGPVRRVDDLALALQAGCALSGSQVWCFGGSSNGELGSGNL
ncbi:MAG: hypothetical protein ACI9OJ_003257, partial [Myxococcota bacterium]